MQAISSKPDQPLDRERPVTVLACDAVVDDALSIRVDAGGHDVPVTINYRLHGRFGPVVLVLGGINAGRDIATWWPRQFGAGRALDPGRLRLLSVDWAEPESGDASPVLTADHAQAIEAVLARLGIGHLHAVVGASFGAMVGLALAERDRVGIGRLLLISGAHQSHPAATAIRHLQREIVRLGEIAGLPGAGLSIARGLAMTGYRTRTLFAHRFDEPSAADRLASLESYLGHVGRQFATRYAPEQFLRLSESLDLHEVDPERVRVPATLVAVDSDQLVPIEQMRSLADALSGPVEFRVLESAFGHDAFLTEHTAIHRLLTDCLEEKQHVSA